MVAILVPVLNRPHRVAPLLESIMATSEATVLFLTTPGDDEEAAAIDAVGAQRLDVEWTGTGEYARKINAGIGATSDPYVFIGADDLRFHDGWFEAASAPMADPAIGVVGTNDLGNPSVLAGDHATHCLVRRDYVAHGTIDEPGKLLHEGYAHNFVDNELVETAKTRGAWAFAGDSVVEHLHPSWAKSERDDTYNLGRRRFERDRRYFHRRQPLWTSQSS